MSAQPILFFESESAWEQWLEANHAAAQGVWLKIAKKDSGHASVTYAEALNVALCFGWIDGQKGRFDAQFWLQKFTPRRARSPWSRINQQKVADLIAQGRMREAGLREIERAKADGRWNAAYESQSRITVPADFQALLAANPAAQTFFDQMDSANRYAILYRIASARKAETRRKRMEQFLAMLLAREKIYG